MRLDDRARRNLVRRMIVVPRLAQAERIAHLLLFPLAQVLSPTGLHTRRVRLQWLLPDAAMLQQVGQTSSHLLVACNERGVWRL